MMDANLKGTMRASVWSALALSALCLLGVVASVRLYADRGDVLLARMDVSVGEVLMNEGIRLEEGGFIHEAVAQYRVALRARYQGEQNRIYTLERLGRLLVARGAYETALPLLREVYDSEHARVTAYAPLVEALFQLALYDEGADVSARWLTAADGNVLEEAAAHFHSGRFAQALQRTEASFLRHYRESSRRVPGGAAAWALAQHYAANGQREEALEQVAAFLLYGAMGADRTAAEKLRAELLKRFS